MNNPKTISLSVYQPSHKSVCVGCKHGTIFVHEEVSLLGCLLNLGDYCDEEKICRCDYREEGVTKVVYMED